MERKKTGLIVLIVCMAALICTSQAVAMGRDTLKIGFSTKIPALDFYKTTGREPIQIANMIMDSLVSRNPETGKIEPRLARSWKVIDDTTWEFTLQPKVTFHNGNPCTAQAVKFTVEERILSEAQKSPQRGNFKWIKEVQVVDDSKFRLITEKPYPLVLERLDTLFIYDPVYCKQVGDKVLAEAPMGTGPYRFVKWDRGSQLVLKKNSSYWEKGVPKIENVIIRIIPELSTRLAELLSGGIDFGVYFSPDTWKTMENSKEVEAMEVPILRVSFWQFDVAGRASKSPVMDRRVRQAVWHAIDRDAIIKEVLQGYGTVLNAPVHPLQFGHDPSIKGYDYNPEKARRLLKEAGYEKGFDLDLWQYRELQNQANQAAMGYLSKVGINVKIHDYRGNLGQLIKLRDAGKVSGIGNYTWGSYNIFDADAILANFFMLSEKKCYSSDKELDAWLNDARNTLDGERRKQLYSKAQHRIIEEAYWMPFYVVHLIMGRHKDLNITVGRDETIHFNRAYWR